jgi:prephenate dehydrogenase
MLQKEFKYYLDHQDELVKQHFGRYIVVKDEKILGDFGSEVEAILFAKNNLHLEQGTFLVQHCMPGKENFTNFFHARVMFMSQ